MESIQHGIIPVSTESTHFSEEATNPPSSITTTLKEVGGEVLRGTAGYLERVEDRGVKLGISTLMVLPRLLLAGAGLIHGATRGLVGGLALAFGKATNTKGAEEFGTRWLACAKMPLKSALTSALASIGAPLGDALSFLETGLRGDCELTKWLRHTVTNGTFAILKFPHISDGSLAQASLPLKFLAKTIGIYGKDAAGNYFMGDKKTSRLDKELRCVNLVRELGLGKRKPVSKSSEEFQCL